MKKTLIRLTEQDLHKVIQESVNKILKEDGYSYNGPEAMKQLAADIDSMPPTEEERNKIYKKNIMLFRKAYNKVLKEYSIVDELTRGNNEAKVMFSFISFIGYVKEVEGDTLYEPLWEQYGGEYEELADQYLYSTVTKLKG